MAQYSTLHVGPHCQNTRKLGLVFHKECGQNQKQPGGKAKKVDCFLGTEAEKAAALDNGRGSLKSERW